MNPERTPPRSRRTPELPVTTHVTVTAAEIARLAGVGRAAVSNWRRRHDDFPDRVGGTDASPLFDLRDVEEWLRRQGKLAEVAPRELLWPELDALGDRDRMGLTIAAAGREMLRRLGAPVPPTTVPPADQDADLARRAADIADQDGADATFGFLCGRWLDAHVRQITTTPSRLGILMAELAAAGAGSVGTVLDPACGSGGLLLAALAHHGGDGPLTLLGQERDRTLADLAAVRLAIAVAGTATGTAATTAAGTAIGIGTTVTGTAVTGSTATGSTATRTAAGAATANGTATADAAGTGATAAETAAGAAATASSDGGAPAGTRIEVVAGDSLLADAHPASTADVALCNPPFNERAWGHDELTNDQRWVHGVPPRAESELAWVQHTLAHLRPGGHAVVLMPPAAASRRTGRRIRAELLRRGALRAVVALPPGAAPPYSIALHVWVLCRPADDGPLDPVVLLVDAAGGGDRRQWDELHGEVLGAWREFLTEGAGTAERAGAVRAVRAIDLLDDEVDLTPARHVPAAAPGADAEHLHDAWDNLSRHVERAAELARVLRRLTPRPAGDTAAATATVADLAREGALTVVAGSAADPGVVHPGDGPGRVPLLTAEDLVAGGTPASFIDPANLRAGHPRAADGDVVVAALAREGAARVVTGPGAAVGAQLFVLRPAPGVLDPWFLAGCLRASSNVRRAGTHASTASRMDVRRLQVPRLPIDEQRRLGELFRAVEEFDAAVGGAAALGTDLARTLTDALAQGTVRPEDEPG